MRMYFPKPYSDETVYSLLARYQVHVGSVVGEHYFERIISTASSNTAHGSA